MTTGNITGPNVGDIRESIRSDVAKRGGNTGFESVMNMRLNADGNKAVKTQGPKGSVNVEGGNVVKDNLKQDKTKADGDVKTKKDVLPADDESGAVEESIEKKLVDRLGVDEKVLAEVLSQLGIINMSDINEDTIKEIAVALTGESSISAILTNEETMNMYNGLMDFVNEYNTVMDLTSIADFDSQLMDETVVNPENEILDEELPQTDIAVDKTKDSEIEFVVNASVQDEKSVSDDNDSKTAVKDDVKSFNVDDRNGKADFQVNAREEEADTDKGSSMRDNREGQSDNHMLDKFVENLNDALNVNTQSESSVNSVSFDESISQGNVMNDIVRQIVDSVRINISSESTSMEMILNPEHLGRLNLSVTSKAGVMTAQFIVENETARQAIEGQIQILKDNLEQQGVRVEAVEVTINNAGNFTGNSNTGEGNSEQSATSKTKTRRININLMDEEPDEEMDEDEQIIAQVMKQEGSNVNFSA